MAEIADGDGGEAKSIDSRKGLFVFIALILMPA
jgi:hypothetical protein